jgi:hypothetical protein
MVMAKGGEVDIVPGLSWLLLQTPTGGVAAAGLVSRSSKKRRPVEGKKRTCHQRHRELL